MISRGGLSGFRAVSSTAVAVFLLFAATGCGSTDRIEIGGRVTRKNGEPLAGARVSFRSEATGKTARGFTDADGRYVLGTAQVGEGIQPGEYLVTVSENRGDLENPRPITINPRYFSSTTSGLKFKVEPGGENTYDIVVDPVR